MMYINGQWVNAVSGSIFPVHNPSNNEKIGEAADGNQDDARQAIEAAHGAFETWSGLTAYQRSEYLYMAYQSKQNFRSSSYRGAVYRGIQKPCVKNACRQRI